MFWAWRDNGEITGVYFGLKAFLYEVREIGESCWLISGARSTGSALPLSSSEKHGVGRWNMGRSVTRPWSGA
jgi:hypothetical protein